jgi:hypothetical protein
MTRLRIHASDFPSDKDYPDFRSYMEAIQKYNREAEDSVRGWLNAGIKEFSNKEGTQFGVISPTFSEGDEGIGRITWYASYGLSGHVFFSDEKKLIEELISGLGHGIQPAEGSLDQLSVTEEWQQGMEHVKQVQKFNEESWKKSQGVLLKIKVWIR